MTEPTCDCDYWHSKHRWHCATNYPARIAPTTADVKASLDATRKADQEARDRRHFGKGEG